ncbi:uncharacterized protein LOC134201672 [Bombyx mori]|uniref:uncharacterized protein LOC134201672 n=1 Tax=Bombyx mori TaxID=7091 RepID=UPI002ED0A72D
MKQRHIHAQISRSSDKFEEDEAPIPLARKVLKNCFRRRSTRRYLSYRMKNLEQSNQRDFDVVGPRAPAALSFHHSGSRGGKLEEQQRGYSTAVLRASRRFMRFTATSFLLPACDAAARRIQLRQSHQHELRDHHVAAGRGPAEGQQLRGATAKQPGWPNVTDVTSAVMPCRQPSRQAILTRPLPPQPPPPPPAKANEGGIVLIKQAVPAISNYFSAFLHK